MNEQPLQSTGVVLAAGVLLDRLFLRKPKVRVFKEPVRTRSTWDAGRWSDAADARLQRFGRAGQQAAGKAGMATQRLMARSQEYGRMARSTVEAHPWAGLGAVLAASGLLTTGLMRRRDPAPGAAYLTVDERRNGTAWQRREYDTQTGLGGMMSSRPVTSGAVVLGLGMLAGAMLSRRTG